MWSARNKDHPFDYDFQLLELADPLKFDDNIQAIKVAHIEDMVIGKVITVTGWGNTKENVSIVILKVHYAKRYFASNNLIGIAIRQSRRRSTNKQENASGRYKQIH